MKNNVNEDQQSQQHGSVATINVGKMLSTLEEKDDVDRIAIREEATCSSKFEPDLEN